MSASLRDSLRKCKLYETNSVDSFGRIFTVRRGDGAWWVEDPHRPINVLRKVIAIGLKQMAIAREHREPWNAMRWHDTVRWANREKRPLP